MSNSNYDKKDGGEIKNFLQASWNLVGAAWNMGMDFLKNTAWPKAVETFNWLKKDGVPAATKAAGEAAKATGDALGNAREAVGEQLENAKEAWEKNQKEQSSGDKSQAQVVAPNTPSVANKGTQERGA
ncbi:MAG: hypothetical protein EAZ74_02260 [Alphaproteobacteria bacterium]|nr:MAG: hypothetical protein EAY76_02220 [Alphaproteobacteria bacterium]TAF15242.1 MAG: hypothetical protein EAZ74_02260 [Alphaproteobacteria bacterium]TAF41062.1 MAG: hypothetical protein EAZ66_02015 [Alphaproteobacteria bacterium]TAF76316.1 MAG: hypothetical protein EAZ52_04520 [Alphaproteobacteria bacterium]